MQDQKKRNEKTEKNDTTPYLHKLFETQNSSTFLHSCVGKPLFAIRAIVVLPSHLSLRTLYVYNVQRLPHDTPNIPHMYHLIPSHTSRPPFRTKHAPIYTNDKLCMSIHNTHTSTDLTDVCIWHLCSLLLAAVAVVPDAAGHVVGSGEKDVR